MGLKEKIKEGMIKEKIIKLAAKIERSEAAAKAGAVIGKIPVVKKVNGLSLKKRRIIFTSVGFIAAAAATTLASGLFMGDTEGAEYTEYTVGKGNVTVSISGSGTVEPISQYQVVSLVEGEVLEDTFEEGDTVEKGQLLYKIDSSDMEKTMEKANLSLEKSNMSYESSLEAYNGLTMTAPISGRVTEILVSKGDNVSNGSKIAAIEDDTYLTVKLPFGETDAENLYVGQNVDVTIENTFEVIGGTITRIDHSKRVLDGYSTVNDVEVTIKNPGALKGGTSVTVNAGGIDCYEGGELESRNETFLTAKASGMVTKVVASEGTYVSRGAQIVMLSSDSAADSLKSSKLSMREAELSYESTQEQLDNYNITAPICGSVISKTVKAGDTLDSSGSSQTVMAVIADMSVMTFTIDVDELDIASMKEGQEVNITADALSNRKFAGYVDNIGLLGTSENGVTSYPVTIVINDAEGLWPGMNISADIVVNSVSDVLTVPVAAVNRGDKVLVKGAKGEESTEGKESIDQSAAPAGSYYAQVELGLNDESYIEVKSGLSEGDVVFVPVEKSSTTENSSQQDMMMPGGGFGGGQMPEGGPPAGGGYSGGGRSNAGGSGQNN